MKKFFRVIIPIAILAVIVVACVGCAENKTNLEKLCERTSYMQNALYTATDDNFDVSLSIITQEEHFIADGKTDKVMQISTLTLSPHNVDTLANTYEYTLKGSKSSASGSISKSKLGINLACRIENFAELGELESLTLTLGETNLEYSLENICPTDCNGDDALEIAYSHFQEKIDGALADKSFDRECYVKLINKSKDDDKYLWYVSFIKDKGDYWSAIIDPQTREVVHARESK
ncbi:MAG: hypothetical protein K2L52_02210 [Clostridia bacterium]|nr:hypothetical protein [Clostridia bacterium]